VPIELTTTEWLNLLGIVVCAGAAVSALRGGRRWAALLVLLVAAQCLAAFIALRANAYQGNGYVISLPFSVAVLLLLGRVREEAERRKAARTGGAGERTL
jgi:hypothetical protein